jgi:CubicO group peptidase (beta-lactamase class C family)
MLRILTIGGLLLTAGLTALLSIAELRGAGQPTGRATPDAVGLSAERLQLATAVLRQAVADQKIAGAVALVARHGKVAYLEPVGMRDRAARTPMDERTIFRIYSQTKAITAVAVMMLVEEGKVRLADPASRHLPEFKNVMVQGPDGPRKPSREITVEDLLLHTSGLSHRGSELYRARQVRVRTQALAQFVTNITQAPLMEDPGTRFRYSEGTTALGRLVEVVSGTPFDAFVTERILKPLQMHDTGFWVEGEAQARLATVYQVAPAGGLAPFEIEEAVPFTARPALIEGAVGLVSTAPDFVRFCQMLLNNGELDGVRLLSARTVAQITVNSLPPAVLQQRGSGVMGWGLANVDVVVSPSSRGYLTAAGEYGWDGSAGTFFSIDPVRQLIVLLNTQNVPASPDGLRQRFKAAVDQSVVSQ